MGKYQGRLREFSCTLDQCFGLGSTCAYGAKTLTYCHLHMDHALEDEAKSKYMGKEDDQTNQSKHTWEAEELWREDPSEPINQRPLPPPRRLVSDERPFAEDDRMDLCVQKRRLPMDSAEPHLRYPK